MRTRLALACLLACALGGAAPSGALAFERIEGAFLAEYSATSYTIDQGEIVTFGNSDKFLSHGVQSDSGSLFTAPVIVPGQVRLVRGAPFLTTGTYPFHCPIHLGMTSELVVNASGSPLPADAVQPAATIGVKDASAVKIARKRKVRLVINPTEAADAVIKAGAGGELLGRVERTWLGPGPRALTISFSRSAAKALDAAAQEGRVPLRLKVTLSDVAGNAATVKRTRGLAGAPKKPKKGKGKQGESATSPARPAP